MAPLAELVDVAFVVVELLEDRLDEELDEELVTRVLELDDTVVGFELLPSQVMTAGPGGVYALPPLSGCPVDP